MTKRIVAFFASSVLCVSLTLPAQAEEKTGIVAAVDRDGATLTFADGSRYRLPAGLDLARVEPGMEAHVLLDCLGDPEV